MRGMHWWIWGLLLGTGCAEKSLHAAAQLDLDTGTLPDDATGTPIDDSGSHDDTATPPAVVFAGIAEATWDGASGLRASWEPATAEGEIAYTLILTDPDGVEIATVHSGETAASVTGLPAGEYWLRVVATAGEQATDGGVQLHQLVGSNRLVYRSEVPLRGAMDVWGDDNIHVIAGGLNPEVGVYVVDTTDPVAPEIIATLTDIGFVRDIKIGGGLLFTTVDPASDGCTLCDEVGIRIFDFSDPADPVLRGEIGSPDSEVHNVSYLDGFLYVTSSSDDILSIYDVTDPSDPQRIASWSSEIELPPPPPPAPHGGSVEPGASPHDQVAIGDRLLVAHVMGFSEADISDPHNPETVWDFFVERGGHSIWPLSDGVHVATTQEIVGGHLRIWDMSDPDAPVEVASHTTGEEHCIHNVYIDGNLLWASWYKDGVLVFDVTDPATPVLLGQYDTNEDEIELLDFGTGPVPDISGAWGVWPFGKHVAVGDSERGLIILDFFPVTVTPED
jgi:hypothetical protein